MRSVLPEAPSQSKAADTAQRRAVLAIADTLLAAIDELLAEPVPEPVPSPR